MEYTQLDTETYKHQLIAKNVYNREVEYFHYEFDKQNFEAMLTTLPDGPQKQDIEKRLADTITQMEIVDKICTALKTQITDQTLYTTAVTSEQLKRDAEVTI